MKPSLLIAALLLGARGAPAPAQIPPGLPIPPENFAVLHPFAAPGSAGMRNAALGGAYAADGRCGWHGNPAGVASVRHPTAATTYNHYPFDRMPDLQSLTVAYAYPCGERGAAKVALFQVRGEGSVIGGPVPVTVNARESDLGLGYAWKVNDQLTAGVSVAYLETSSTYQAPGMGTVTRLTSRPDGPGGRLGAVYDLSDAVALGATFDWYREKVVQEAPALGLPTQSYRLTSRAVRVGVAFRLDPYTTVLADYQDLALSGGSARITRRPWAYGIEQRVGDVALRLGSYDGSLTGGVGIYTGKVEFGYTFTGRARQDVPGQGGGTAHLVQFLVSW